MKKSLDPLFASLKKVKKISPIIQKKGEGTKKAIAKTSSKSNLTREEKKILKLVEKEAASKNKSPKKYYESLKEAGSDYGYDELFKRAGVKRKAVLDEGKFRPKVFKDELAKNKK